MPVRRNKKRNVRSLRKVSRKKRGTTRRVTRKVSRKTRRDTRKTRRKVPKHSDRRTRVRSRGRGRKISRKNTKQFGGAIQWMTGMADRVFGKPDPMRVSAAAEQDPIQDPIQGPIPYVRFDNIFEERPHVFCFNPSVAHWKDDYYLCSYRRFSRAIDDRRRDVPWVNKNHPWVPPEWDPGFHRGDETAICLLKIERGEGGGYTFAMVTQVDAIASIDVQDARLLKIESAQNPDRFLISYNARDSVNWIAGNNSPLNCREDGCYIIGAQILTLNQEGGIQDWGLGLTVCPEVSQRTEKNWSFWLTDNNDVRFSYNICPNHDVFAVNVRQGTVPGRRWTGPVVTCGGGPANNWDCKPICMSRGNQGLGRQKIYQDTNCELLENLQLYYDQWGHDGSTDDRRGPALKVSVTTPAIPFGDNYRLGVGHIKFHYTPDDLGRLREERGVTNLETFVHQAFQKNLMFHPTWVYLMYLYKFDVRDGKVTHISHMFLPECDTTLCFPSGLTRMNPRHHGENILLTYGNMDITCDAMVLPDVTIDSMLCIPTNSRPEIVQFQWIPA